MAIRPFVQSTWGLSILAKNKIYNKLLKIGNENIVMAPNYSSLKLKTCKKRLHFPHLTLVIIYRLVVAMSMVVVFDGGFDSHLFLN